MLICVKESLLVLWAKKFALNGSLPSDFHSGMILS
jgi:hypothetical protein